MTLLGVHIGMRGAIAIFEDNGALLAVYEMPCLVEEGGSGADRRRRAASGEAAVSDGRVSLAAGTGQPIPGMPEPAMKPPDQRRVAWSDCGAQYPPALVFDQHSAGVAVWWQRIVPTRRRRP
jgi:hypothetical protein